jgi:hypothetical protein
MVFSSSLSKWETMLLPWVSHNITKQENLCCLRMMPKRGRVTDKWSALQSSFSQAMSQDELYISCPDFLLNTRGRSHFGDVALEDASA